MSTQFSSQEHKAFKEECLYRSTQQYEDLTVRQISDQFLKKTSDFKYSYNFEWLGRPIIQYPQDIVAIQEIIFKTNPSLIIETGIAHGGSLILSASILALLDLMGLPKNVHERKVIGIDIDIRKHNRLAIEKHPLSSYIQLIEGSSIDVKIAKKIHDIAATHDSVMVILDSNHTESHVLKELELYALITTVGNYCVVYDTDIELFPQGYFEDRPWDVGNNPMTAVNKWIQENHNFHIDTSVDSRLLVSCAPRGYLRRLN